MCWFVCHVSVVEHKDSVANRGHALQVAVSSSMVAHVLTEEPDPLPSSVHTAVMSCMTSQLGPACIIVGAEDPDHRLTAVFGSTLSGSTELCVTWPPASLQELPACDRSSSKVATMQSSASALATQMDVLDSTFTTWDDPNAVCRPSV